MYVYRLISYEVLWMSLDTCIWDLQIVLLSLLFGILLYHNNSGDVILVLFLCIIEFFCFPSPYTSGFLRTWANQKTKWIFTLHHWTKIKKQKVYGKKLCRNSFKYCTLKHWNANTVDEPVIMTRVLCQVNP